MAKPLAPTDVGPLSTDTARLIQDRPADALALYHAIFAHSTEAIAIVDPDGRFLEQNLAHQRLLGYDADELRGRLIDLESIFEPFVQVDTGFSARFDGAGLGLAISRELARAMDGEGSVESTLGEGSTFTVVLPRGENRAENEVVSRQ